MVVITATAPTTVPQRRTTVPSPHPCRPKRSPSKVRSAYSGNRRRSCQLSIQTPRTGDSRRMHTTRTTRSTTWRGNRSCRTSDFWGSLVWWTSQWAARWFERGTRPWWSRLQWSQHWRPTCEIGEEGNGAFATDDERIEKAFDATGVMLMRLLLLLLFSINCCPRIHLQRWQNWETNLSFSPST